MMVTEGKTKDNAGNDVHFLRIKNNTPERGTYHIPIWCRVTGVASPSFDRWLPWLSNELDPGEEAILRIEQGTMPDEMFSKENLPGGDNFIADEENPSALWTPNRAARRAGISRGQWAVQA
jgi:hypothetical protein